MVTHTHTHTHTHSLTHTLHTDGKRYDPDIARRYQMIKNHVQSYLSRNQYSKVDLTRLFPVLSV